VRTATFPIPTCLAYCCQICQIRLGRTCHGPPVRFSQFQLGTFAPHMFANCASRRVVPCAIMARKTFCLATVPY
jgi:hypothetical protein